MLINSSDAIGGRRVAMSLIATFLRVLKPSYVDLPLCQRQRFIVGDADDDEGTISLMADACLPRLFGFL